MSPCRSVKLSALFAPVTLCGRDRTPAAVSSKGRSGWCNGHGVAESRSRFDASPLSPRTSAVRRTGARQEVSAEPVPATVGSRPAAGEGTRMRSRPERSHRSAAGRCSWQISRRPPARTDRRVRHGASVTKTLQSSSRPSPGRVRRATASSGTGDAARSLDRGVRPDAEDDLLVVPGDAAAPRDAGGAAAPTARRAYAAVLTALSAPTGYGRCATRTAVSITSSSTPTPADDESNEINTSICCFGGAAGAPARH